MRENLAVGLVVLCVLAATGGIVGIANRNATSRPIDVSPSALDGDAAFYDGAHVRVPTGGAQAGPGPDTLVYRKRADLEPVVVFEFDAPVPDPVPPRIVGRVAGRRGPAVVVTGCRPAP